MMEDQVIKIPTTQKEQERLKRKRRIAINAYHKLGDSQSLGGKLKKRRGGLHEQQ